jgi:pseudouridine-5'-phosphate glycosidase
MLHFSPEVKAALDQRRPIVALESTIIAHGFSYPANLELAYALEQCIRDRDAVPATIAILAGTVTIGCTSEQLGEIATEKAMPKASMRDLAALAAAGQSGATTVAATAHLAHLGGIRVFATGGIGGVHRGAAESGDISADLGILAKVPLVIVSAGAKAILDLQRTLEYLETACVPVVGYRTGEFPAFYSRTSGLALDCRVESAAEAARIAENHWHLDGGGLLIANPISEDMEIPAPEVEQWIAEILKGDDVPRGKALTPYLLRRLKERSDDRSEQANRSLVLNNAALAADIAVALAPGR